MNLFQFSHLLKVIFKMQTERNSNKNLQTGVLLYSICLTRNEFTCEIEGNVYSLFK